MRTEAGPQPVKRPGADRLVWALFLVMMAVAVGTRFYNLNATSFWTDELNHVIAAQSLLVSGEPVVPGVGNYTRALPITYLTAASFALFGESEASARAPFALINLVFLWVVFVTIKRMIDPALALIVTFVLVLSPHELQWARECRMYALLQLLYFSGSLLFFVGFESFGRAPHHTAAGSNGSIARKRDRSGGVLIAGALLLAAAVWIQPLAVNFVIALAAYCLAMAARHASRDGLKATTRSRYVLVLAAMAAGTIGVVAYKPSVIEELVKLATVRPVWYKSGDAYWFYYWLFVYLYPGLTCFYLLGCALLMRHRGRIGLFLLCSFAPLLAAHMTIFTGRFAERYIAYIFPFFVIGAGYAVLVLARIGWTRLAHLWRSESRPLAVSIGLAAASIMYLFLYPWVLASPKLYRDDYTTNWKGASAILNRLSDETTVMSTWPQMMMYYTGRFPDYVLMRIGEFGALEDGVVQIGPREIAVRWVLTAEQLSGLIDRHGSVSVVADEWAFYNDAFVDQDTRSLITERMTPVNHGIDKKILIYEINQTGPQETNSETVSDESSQSTEGN